jgi:hypothetical protein
MTIERGVDSETGKETIRLSQDVSTRLAAGQATMHDREEANQVWNEYKEACEKKSMGVSQAHIDSVVNGDFLVFP